MRFRTEIEIKKSSLVLDPEKPVVAVGSCFSQNIATKMNQHLWESINPLGTLYNPISISRALTVMLLHENGKEFFETTLFQDNGIWMSNMFDTGFNSIDREDCILEFVNRKKLLEQKLREGQTLVVTFGTSIAYFKKDDGIIVGNCHKQPSDIFFRERLTITDITNAWIIIVNCLKERFKDLNIIFTVSPVRHLKDTMEGNSKSKAVLLLSIEKICRDFDFCHYFPAFEIINDDLRDYRFYSSDLVHPSEEGIEYIWEKFRQAYIDEKGNRLLEEGLSKYKASQHRPRIGALGKPLEKGNHP